MHYQNGREAKIGDKVVGHDGNGLPISGIVAAGIPGSDACNICVVPLPLYLSCSQQAKFFLHVDDAVSERVKRCPIDAGGCGALVDFLFDSGLCSGCDAAVKRGTAAATTGEPKRGRKPGATNDSIDAVTAPPQREIKRRGPRGPYKKKAGANGDEPPKHKRSYVRRIKARPGPLPSSNNPLLLLEQLRAECTAERDAAMKTVVMLETRMEVLDDLEERFRRL